MKANTTQLVVQTQFTTSWDKYVEGIIQIRKPSSIYPISHVIIS